MATAPLRAGDRVQVPWGFDMVPGTLVALYGPPGSPHALVDVEFDGPEGAIHESISFPVRALERLGAPSTTA